jgi:TonB-linked SusC/RagA family outer membrane protein
MKRIFIVILIGCLCTNLLAQKIISGIVRDGTDNMNVLPGVSVQVKGTTRGSVTDLNGKYTITVQSGDKELIFSFIGMKSQAVSIGNKTVIDVTLTTDDNLLNEVVVSALGIKRENRSLTVAQQRVNAETMAEVRDQNIVSALAGKVAGVMITPPPSSTGSARIVIRGNSSFTGDNQPLFVIDGMQIDNSDGSKSVNKNDGLDLGNGASDINADDIESIDVLKGPNAAALYGSRAANGVIIITTKKAKDGRFKLSFNSNTMFRYISQWPAFQNAFGVGHVSTMIGGDGGKVLEIYDAEGNMYPYPGIPSIQKVINVISQSGRSNGGPHIGIPYIGLDGNIHTYSPQPGNVYDFYQKASTFTNNVAVEGGNIDNNYRVSLTNFHADDVVEKQNMVNKNTITTRFYNTLIKNLTLDSKITVIDEDTKNRRYSNQSNFNPLYMYTIMPRTMTLDQLANYKLPDGTEAVTLSGIHNPYWTINETANEDKKLRVLANFDLSYQILPALRVSLKYGREYINTKTFEYKNKGAQSTDIKERSGFYKEQFNTTDNTMYEWLLVYNQHFFKDLFSVVGTIGGSRLDYNGFWAYSQIETLKQAGLAHISNSDNPPKSDESIAGRKRINSVYASASFGYGDFIYLDLTGRNDWSSTLPKAHNSYFYPSVGISWIPTELLKIPTRIFYGKVRASYAQVGNDTYPYRLEPYYNFDANNRVNGYSYASIDGTLPNPQLKPETTGSYEIGADLRFLNGRINLDLTYYNSRSFDQIVEAEMAASSGYNKRVYNAGEIENKGWEIAARVRPIENRLFNWSADINFTKNTSMVKKMIEGADRIQLGEVFDMLNVVQLGYPYGSMFGRQWLKDQQGRLMVTSDGSPVKKENVYLGNFNPDFLLGIGNMFRYKNFDLYVLIDIKKGGKLYSGTMRQAIRNGVISGYEKDHEAYWMRKVIMGDSGGSDDLWGGTIFDNIYYYKPEMYDNTDNMNPVDPNYVPEKCNLYYWPGDIGYYVNDVSEELVTYDASFVKLREVSIGFNLPKSLIYKIKMTNARISIVGRNLWTFYQKTPRGIDPEAALNAGNGQGLESGSLPPTTTLGFDIKIAF